MRSRGYCWAGNRFALAGKPPVAPFFDGLLRLDFQAFGLAGLGTGGPATVIGFFEFPLCFRHVVLL